MTNQCVPPTPSPRRPGKPRSPPDPRLSAGTPVPSFSPSRAASVGAVRGTKLPSLSKVALAVRCAKSKLLPVARASFLGTRLPSWSRVALVIRRLSMPVMAAGSPASPLPEANPSSPSCSSANCSRCTAHANEKTKVRGGARKRGSDVETCCFRCWQFPHSQMTGSVDGTW